MEERLQLAYKNCVDSTDDINFFRNLEELLRIAFENPKTKNFIELSIKNFEEKEKTQANNYRDLVINSLNQVKSIIRSRKIKVEFEEGKVPIAFLFEANPEKYRPYPFWQELRNELVFCYSSALKALGEDEFIKNQLGVVKDGKLIEFYQESQIKEFEFLKSKEERLNPNDIGYICKELHDFHYAFNNIEEYLLKAQKRNDSYREFIGNKYINELASLQKDTSPDIRKFTKKNYLYYIQTFFLHLPDLKIINSLHPLDQPKFKKDTNGVYLIFPKLFPSPIKLGRVDKGIAKFIDLFYNYRNNKFEYKRNIEEVVRSVQKDKLTNKSYSQQKSYLRKVVMEDIYKLIRKEIISNEQEILPSDIFVLEIDDEDKSCFMRFK